MELSTTINGERTIITLERYAKSTLFNPSTQKVKGDKETNDYLEIIRKKCYHIENELTKLDKLDLDTFVLSFKNGISYNEDMLLKIYAKVMLSEC